MSTRIAVATAIGCLAALPLLGLEPEYVGRAAGVQKPTKGPASFASYIKLPSLGSNAEANGINDAGTVIVGRSFDRAGLLYAVKWTQQNGTWVISALPAPVPYPGSAAARGIAPSTGPLPADLVCSAATAMSERRMPSARTARSLSDGSSAVRRQHGTGRGPAQSFCLRSKKGDLRRPTPSRVTATS